MPNILSRAWNWITNKLQPKKTRTSSMDQIAKTLYSGTTDAGEAVKLARAENERGDAAYIAKDFTTADAHYRKALEYSLNVANKTSALNVELARSSYRIAAAYQSNGKSLEAKIHFEIARIIAQDFPAISSDLNFNYKNIKALSTELSLGVGAPNVSVQNVPKKAQPNPAQVEAKITSAIAQSVSVQARALDQAEEQKNLVNAPDQARKQAFSIMRAQVLEIGDPNKHSTLLEQKNNLLNAYKLLQSIPNKDKTLQDLSRIMSCANLLGNVLREMKDQRAQDVVQKMGIGYCEKVAADPENHAFHYLLDVSNMAKQFAANPLGMTQYIFAKSDAYEQLGNLYLIQNDRKSAADCFRKARELCQQGIPEKSQLDSVAQRIDRFKLAEAKARPAANVNIMDEVEKIIATRPHL